MTVITTQLNREHPSIVYATLQFRAAAELVLISSIRCASGSIHPVQVITGHNRQHHILNIFISVGILTNGIISTI